MKKTFEPEEYFAEYSSLILEFKTNYHKQIVSEILSKDDYIDEPKRFFYTIIHKTICSLEAANIFVRNFDSKRNLQTPLFIILRSILSDIIVSEYIIIKGKSDKERVELIEQVYFDHIDNIIKTCEKTANLVYQWNNEEYLKNIDSLKKNNRFFDSSGNPKLKALQTSPNVLIRKIFSTEKDKEPLKLLKIAFDLYSTFSKFEHLGGLSFNLTHRGYDDKLQENLRSELYDSIRIITTALNNYSTLWDDYSQVNWEYFKELELKIIEMTPDKIKSA